MIIVIGSNLVGASVVWGLLNAGVAVHWCHPPYRPAPPTPGLLLPDVLTDGTTLAEYEAWLQSIPGAPVLERLPLRVSLYRQRSWVPILPEGTAGVIDVSALEAALHHELTARGIPISVGTVVLREPRTETELVGGVEVNGDPVPGTAIVICNGMTPGPIRVLGENPNGADVVEARVRESADLLWRHRAWWDIRFPFGKRLVATQFRKRRRLMGRPGRGVVPTLGETWYVERRDSRLVLALALGSIGLMALPQLSREVQRYL